MKETKKTDAQPRFAKTAEPMSGDTFRASLEELDISQSAFARLIGVGDRTVRTWINGKFPVPMAVGFLVTLMLRTKTEPEDLKIIRSAAFSGAQAGG